VSLQARVSPSVQVEIFECRCDERLKTKVEESTRLTYTAGVARGTGTPNDRDEVNRRDVYECDG